MSSVLAPTLWVSVTCFYKPYVRVRSTWFTIPSQALPGGLSVSALANPQSTELDKSYLLVFRSALLLYGGKGQRTGTGSSQSEKLHCHRQRGTKGPEES